MSQYFKYIIDDIPPSNNKFKGRQNHWEYRELKKQWEAIVYYQCRPRPPKPLNNVYVKITYFFPTMHRRDPDNYNGVFLLDGLVKAGVLKDDSFGCITLLLDGRHDEHKPRTEIEIMERVKNNGEKLNETASTQESKRGSKRRSK